MDEDDDAVPRPFRASTLQHALDELEVRYRETGNPVFVWQALSIQRAARLVARYTGHDVPPLIVPAWTEEYFLSTATKLSRLANGIRVRRSKTGPSLLSVVQDDVTGSMKDVTAALLGLTGQGENAFKNYHATLLGEWTAVRMEQLQLAGHSRDEAVAQIKQESGHVESSVIAKRAALGNRIRSQIRALRHKGTIIH